MTDMPWAGAPVDITEWTSGNTTTSVSASPNHSLAGGGSDENETSYSTQTSKTNEDGKKTFTGSITLVHGNQDGPESAVVLNYTNMKNYVEALEALENGELPDPDKADVVTAQEIMPDEAPEEEEKDKKDKDETEGSGQRFNLWRFLGLKKGNSGEGIWDDSGGIDWRTIYGVPSVLTFEGGEVQVEAEGVEAVKGWISEHSAR
ncbi:MAG: hypothetical protein AAGH60_05875 [Pseudomonadota bacterium]